MKIDISLLKEVRGKAPHSDRHKHKLMYKKNLQYPSPTKLLFKRIYLCEGFRKVYKSLSQFQTQ